VADVAEVGVASDAARAGDCSRAMWLVHEPRNAKIFTSTGILRPADVNSAVDWACANE
jgi:hypothetical protein